MWDRVGCIWTTLTCAQAYSWLVQRSLLQTWDHRRCRSWNWTQIDSLQGKHLTPLTLMWRIFKCPFHDITLLTMVLKPEVFKKAMVLKPEVIWVSSTGWGGSSLESLTCVGRDWHLVTLPRGWSTADWCLSCQDICQSWKGGACWQVGGPALLPSLSQQAQGLSCLPVHCVLFFNNFCCAPTCSLYKQDASLTQNLLCISFHPEVSD